MGDGVEEDRIVWTSFRTLEPNPYPFTPMTQSVLREGLSESMWTTLFDEGKDYAKIHNGYLLFNLPQIQNVIGRIFEIPESVLVSYMQDERKFAIEDVSFRPSLSGIWLLLLMQYYTVKLFVRGTFAGQLLPSRPSVGGLDDSEIVSHINRHQNYLFKMLDAHILLSGLAEAYTVGIVRYTPIEKTRTEIQGILSNWTRSKTIQMALKASKVGSEGELQDFLDEFGHRCPREMEIAVPRWSEDSDSLIRSDTPFSGKSAKEFESDRTPTILWQLFLFPGTVLERMRENPKNEWLKSYAYLRKLLLEIGRRASQSGHLSNPEDIFYLPIDTAIRLAENRPSRNHIRPMVARNKANHQRNLEYSPPIFLNKDLEPISRDGEITDENNDPKKISGLGVSQGVIEGEAILASTPEEVEIPENVPAILVTEFTDAGWTPLFFQIDGLIMERGSLLSHGSIVAREAGIPAVVNVDGALEEINNGDIVRIDGSKGCLDVIDQDITPGNVRKPSKK